MAEIPKGVRENWLKNDVLWCSYTMEHGNLKDIVSSIRGLVESITIVGDIPTAGKANTLHKEMEDKLVVGHIGEPTVRAYGEEILELVR